MEKALHAHRSPPQLLPCANILPVSNHDKDGVIVASEPQGNGLSISGSCTCPTIAVDVELQTASYMISNSHLSQITTATSNRKKAQMCLVDKIASKMQAWWIETVCLAFWRDSHATFHVSRPPNAPNLCNLGSNYLDLVVHIWKS